MQDDMRSYRCIGDATYLDSDDNIRRIGVNYAVDAPDADTAKILVLAEIEVLKGAGADYDPQARWENPWNVVVEDETAKQEAIAACGLAVGDHVTRTRGGSVGIVRALVTADNTGRNVATARRDELHVTAVVDWPAPGRINGSGWRRDRMRAASLRRVEARDAAS